MRDQSNQRNRGRRARWPTRPPQPPDQPSRTTGAGHRRQRRDHRRDRPRHRRCDRPRPAGTGRREGRASRRPQARRGRDRPTDRQPAAARPHPRDPPRPRHHLRRDQQGRGHQPRRGAQEERAASTVHSWRAYLTEHRDEITAIQVLTAARGGGRDALDKLTEIAARIRRPPHAWTPDILWDAYETLGKSVASPRGNAQLPDLVSLIRYELGLDIELKPYRSAVEERFAGWLLRQRQAGAEFTADQVWWLEQIRDTVAIGVGISVEDVRGVPFTERGGQAGLVRCFGRDRARALIAEMDRELA
ncbi:type I restriction-modification enzyme R subunit C-terminal domain-containing protein [Catellatospora coxensis]